MEKLKLNLPGLSALPYDPIAHGQMRADTLNATPGKLTGYDCRKCLNRGYMAKVREDGSIYTVPCKCTVTRHCVREMEASGLEKSIRKMTFEAFRAEDPWQKTLLEAAQAYAAEETESWYMMCGQSGSGKTHLCTAICRQRLWDGKQVRYLPWREVVSTLKGLSLDSEKRRALLDQYRSAQILYIDDFYKCGRGETGKVNPTIGDINLAFELINHRYINNLTTILSTELTPNQLAEIDESVASRIIELAGDHVYSIGKDMKKNYRMHGITEL